MRFVPKGFQGLMPAAALMAAIASAAAIPAAASARQSLGPCEEKAPAARPEALLYVSDSYDSVVRIFEEPSLRCVGVIRRGLNQPSGIALDRHGYLYVANYNARNVAVYAPGLDRPVRIYRTGLTSPSDVAIGPDGTLYVVDGGILGYDSNVVEFASGSTAPARRFRIDQGLIRAVAVDRQNVLYVSYVTNGGVEGEVNRYAPGSTQGTNLELYELGAGTFGVAVDRAGDVLVADSENFKSYINIYPPGVTLPSMTIDVSSDSNTVRDIRLTHSGRLAVAMGAYTTIVCFACSGQSRTINVTTDGVAIFPASL